MGGNAFTDMDGNLWRGDQYFQGGNPYSTLASIDNTLDDTLFQSERFAKTLSYAIPVDNGNYTVNLTFAETYWNQNHRRVFDVRLENTLQVDHLDIHRSVGSNTALERTFDVKVQDGLLNLDLNASLDNAKLSGIEIIPIPSPDVTPAPNPVPEPSPSSGPLMTLALVNAKTDQLVPGYEDLGSISTLDLGQLNVKHYNILAQVNPHHPDAQFVNSIQFDSPFGQHIESVQPYALFGDVNGDFHGKHLKPGDFSLKATAYTQADATGQVMKTVNVNYHVVDSSSAPTTPLPPPDNTPNIVDVNLNVLHTVGGVSEFERKKWINVHSHISETDWRGESDKLNYLFNELDVYLGRSVGGFTWSAINFTPKEMPSVFSNLRNNYGQRTDIHQYEKNTISYKEQIFDKMSGAEAGRHAAEYLNNVYGSGGTSGAPRPQYVELMNEPLAQIGKKASYNEIFDYLQDIATALKANAPADVKIGGFTAAWPTLAPNNFNSWNKTWKNFIDRMGDQVDFYSIHLYDNPTEDYVRSGSYNEAIMDMIEHYGELTGKDKPFVISEYSALPGDLRNQQWSSQRDWLYMKSMNNMMVQFMERPDQILKAVPFVVGKADNEWGYRNGIPYAYRLMRKANEPNSYTGNWVWTDLIKFYELWDDVNGSRVDSVDNNINIQTDAYVDGNKAYVILNSFSTDAETINLNLNGIDNNAVQSVEVRNLFNNGQGADLTVSNHTFDLNSTLELQPGATMIAEYTFKNDVLIDEVSEETKYYADKYLRPISANTANSFRINGVTDSIDGEATLRIGVGRDHNRSLTPVVQVNGTKIDSPVEYRGDDQLARDEFFGVLEVEIPYDLIQTNNTVDITFSDNGGHISSLAMQVFNFSDDIRNEDTLTGGIAGDTFTFDTGTLFDSAGSKADRLLDFTAESDRIILSKDTFTALDNLSDGRLLSTDFEVVTSDALAGGSNAEIVYNASNGNLYYNANNAAAGFGSGGLFATLTSPPDNLSTGNFQVVNA